MTGMQNFHEQAEMFRDALALTRQRTGFVARLIEKDYFCTLLLQYLAWGMPGPLRRYLNRDYQPSAAAEQAMNMSEEDVLRALEKQAR